VEELVVQGKRSNMGLCFHKGGDRRKGEPRRPASGDAVKQVAKIPGAGREKKKKWNYRRKSGAVGEPRDAGRWSGSRGRAS